MPQRELSVAGVVLAGGRNARMGGLDKGLIPFAGIPLARRAVELLGGLFSEVILVTNNPEAYRSLTGRAALVEDLYKDRGPLAGLHAGLGSCRSSAAFCVACDMPFLSARLIRRQVGMFLDLGCDVLLPRMRGEIEPLHGVYKKSLLAEVERILTDGKGYSIRRLYPVVHTEYMELPDSPELRAVFANINTPGELESLRVVQEGQGSCGP